MLIYIWSNRKNVSAPPKAHDRRSHVDATGIDCSDDVVRALSNLSRRDEVGLVTLMVVTAHNWCLQDPSFMVRLGRHHQLAYSRQLLRHDGLVFGPAGYGLPRNAMLTVRLGRMSGDFTDADSFLRFWASSGNSVSLR
jgi:hypothetical protein